MRIRLKKADVFIEMEEIDKMGEITFDDDEGKIMPFFTSGSDEETEREWDRLINEFGINKD